MRCLMQLLLVTLLVPSMYCSRLVLAAPHVSGWARSCVFNLAYSLQCTKWTIVRPSFSLVLIPKWSTKFWPHPSKVFNSTQLPFPRDIFADTVPVMRNHAPVFTKLLLVNLRMIQGTVLSQLLLYIVPQLLINRHVQGMIVKQPDFELATPRPQSLISCPEDHQQLASIVARLWPSNTCSRSVLCYNTVVTNTTLLTH